MFVLLGDPALRLPRTPRDLELTAPAPLKAGATVVIKGRAPARLEGARVRVTLERPVSSVPDDLQPLPQAPDRAEERDRIMLANHERANRFVLVQGEAVIRSRRLEVSLTVPARLPWPKLIVRAYASTDQEEALGVQTVAVQQARPEP